MTNSSSDSSSEQTPPAMPAEIVAIRWPAQRKGKWQFADVNDTVAAHVLEHPGLERLVRADDDLVAQLAIANQRIAQLTTKDADGSAIHNPSLAGSLATYDPNIRWAHQRVRVKLQQWDYSTTIETTVNGNCHGFEIFDSAIDRVFEGLPTRSSPLIAEPVSHIILTNSAGETLECEDEELKYEDWLKPMIVGIEIVGQEPEQAQSAATGEAK